MIDNHYLCHIVSGDFTWFFSCFFRCQNVIKLLSALITRNSRYSAECLLFQAITDHPALFKILKCITPTLLPGGLRGVKCSGKECIHTFYTPERAENGAVFGSFVCFGTDSWPFRGREAVHSTNTFLYQSIPHWERT